MSRLLLKTTALRGEKFDGSPFIPHRDTQSPTDVQARRPQGLSLHLGLFTRPALA